MAHRPSTMRMGPVSLFALIIILCLAVLAVLSASAANASSAMAHRQADFTHDDYVNESVGQELFALADDIAAEARDAGGGQDAVAYALADSLDELSAAAVPAGSDSITGSAVGTDSASSSAGAADSTGGGSAASQTDSAALSAAPSVTLSMDGYELAAHIQAASGRCLDITWEVRDDGALAPVSWKATTMWTEDTTDVLWTGGA